MVPTVCRGEKGRGAAAAWIGHRQGDCIAEGRHLAVGGLHQQQRPSQMEVLRGARVGRQVGPCQMQWLVVPTVCRWEKGRGAAAAWIGHCQGDCVAEGRHLAFGGLHQQQCPAQLEVLRGTRVGHKLEFCQMQRHVVPEVCCCEEATDYEASEIALWMGGAGAFVLSPMGFVNLSPLKSLSRLLQTGVALGGYALDLRLAF